MSPFYKERVVGRSLCDSSNKNELYSGDYHKWANPKQTPVNPDTKLTLPSSGHNFEIRDFCLCNVNQKTYTISSLFSFSAHHGVRACENVCRPFELDD